MVPNGKEICYFNMFVKRG